jgi:predicted ester cyclase
MSNIEIARKFSETLESRNLESLQALLADGFAAKGPSMQLTREQTLGYLKVLFTAFPDYSFGLTDFRQEGESIQCTSHESGTHTGLLDLKPFGLSVSLPPTGKPFRLPGSTFTIHVANDKITYFGEESVPGGGLAGILGQLGVKLP